MSPGSLFLGTRAAAVGIHSALCFYTREKNRVTATYEERESKEAVECIGICCFKQLPQEGAATAQDSALISVTAIDYRLRHLSPSRPAPVCPYHPVPCQHSRHIITLPVICPMCPFTTGGSDFDKLLDDFLQLHAKVFDLIIHLTGSGRILSAPLWLPKPRPICRAQQQTISSLRLTAKRHNQLEVIPEERPSGSNCQPSQKIQQSWIWVDYDHLS
ncbi:uncharacterized protein LOC114569654 isoform X2 [Perca flavescens]|uniref:uncharacterized protein LOC114569654 isoform X2 n=1 Tax=Perca flavescens TaxID=8167 RepID=UPI00106E8C68|nr:uncharacterized protein LOC114569654 isoform X2 [Perca flavescens]